MSEANRHAQSKDLLHLCCTQGLARRFHHEIRLLVCTLKTNMAAYLQTGRRGDAAELRSACSGQRPGPTQSYLHHHYCPGITVTGAALAMTGP